MLCRLAGSAEHGADVAPRPAGVTGGENLAVELLLGVEDGGLGQVNVVEWRALAEVGPVESDGFGHASIIP